MDFGTLKDDKEIQDKLINFQNSITKIEQVLEESLVENVHEQLSTKEKIDFDLFTAYSLNTLYWLYLRSSGEDPNKNDVKNQLNRVKEYMTKAKQVRSIFRRDLFVIVKDYYLLGPRTKHNST